MFREAAPHPVQQINAVGVVVAGDKLDRFAIAQPTQGGFEQPVHDLSRHGEHRVVLAIAVAASAIVEMRQVELVDTLGLHQVQHAREIGVIVLGQGETQADLDAAFPTEPHPRQRRLEGALAPTKSVVRIPQSIQAHTHIIEADGVNRVDVGRGDQGAVARQPHVKAHGLGAAGDLEDVGPQQRLAARQDQHRDAECLQIVHDAEHLLGGQFAGKIDVGGGRVAMLAGEIAAPDQIPDHHGARQGAASGRGGQLGGGWLEQFADEVADAKHESGSGLLVVGEVSR